MMFDEKYDVTQSPPLLQLDNSLLQRQCCKIIHPAQIFIKQLSHRLHHSYRPFCVLSRRQTTPHIQRPECVLIKWRETGSRNQGKAPNLSRKELQMLVKDGALDPNRRGFPKRPNRRSARSSRRAIRCSKGTSVLTRVVRSLRRVNLEAVKKRKRSLNLTHGVSDRSVVSKLQRIPSLLSRR